MSSPEELALHIAVWDNDVDKVIELAKDPKLLESFSPSGDTPFMLALRLNRMECTQALVEAGAFAKTRTPEGWEAVQVAGLTANPALIRLAVLASLSETDAAVERRLPTVRSSLSEVPDFNLRLKWEFSSLIPGLTSLLPNDEWVIFKRGANVRMDTSLLGFKGLQWERGSISMIFSETGKMTVMDCENKTAGDMRLAFTNPEDIQIQDWVRKLTTTIQKSSDFWTKDAQLEPVKKKGLIGGLVGMLNPFGGHHGPRGRISDTEKRENHKHAREIFDLSSTTSRLGVSELSDESTTMNMGTFLGKSDSTSEEVYDLSTIATQEVGMWGQCHIFEIRNLCSREVQHSPVLDKLPLDAWWRPEYAMSSHDKSAEALKAMGEAPEDDLKVVHKMLRAVRLGRTRKSVNEREDNIRVEDVQDVDAHDLRSNMRHTTKKTTFREYFGFIRIPSGSKSGNDVQEVHTFLEENMKVNDKVMDVKVFFSNEFPLQIHQFIPILEILARSSHQAANMRSFFDSKLPKNAGFPVKFTLPVFPTISATVTFEFCDLRSPVASLFEVPKDYKMGEYVERGFIRQI